MFTWPETGLPWQSDFFAVETPALAATLLGAIGYAKGRPKVVIPS